MTPTPTPTKMTTPMSSTPTKSSVDIKVAEIRRRHSARYSILSDPRLSQLFALSSQLEALAHTIEMEAAASVAIDELPESSMSTATPGPASAATKPPHLPPKPKFGLGQGSLTDRSNGNVFKPRPDPKKSSEIQYMRLDDTNDVLNFFNCDYENIFEDNEDNEEGNGAPPGLDLVPPPRYSIISDSRMSTSSQAESTPSANSVLSDSCPTMKADFEARDEPDEPDMLWPDVEDRPEDQPKPKNESEWQARCVELELALQRFRDQAQNIRELLREKVSSVVFCLSVAQIPAASRFVRLRTYARSILKFLLTLLSKIL